MIIIVFGRTGVGKSEFGRTLGKATGVPYIEADYWIPNGGTVLLTNKAVDKFVKDNLIPGIRNELAKNKDIIVAYACFREEHRQMIWRTFKDITEVMFVHVETDAANRHRNLNKRKCACLWRTFASVSERIAFEIPEKSSPISYQTLIHDNSGAENLLAQARELPFYRKLMSLETREYKEPSTGESKGITTTDRGISHGQFRLMKAGLFFVGAAFLAYQAYASAPESMDELRRKVFS